MANWESFTVSEVVSKINENFFVLPVIQRRLVWDEEKMETLFDTVLKGNSFGSIIVIEEEANSAPLFSFRNFTRDGEPLDSRQEQRLSQTQLFVIDGQQRLQSFYIGLFGSLNGKTLYYDIYSDHANLDYAFKFSNDVSRLPKQDNERPAGSVTEHKWYSVHALYNRLKYTNDEEQVADEIIHAEDIQDEQCQRLVSRNIKAFYRNIFIAKNIGVSKVSVNKSMDINANRQRIVELFRRLNDGGTKLSSFDLVASVLKGFEWRMEHFLDEILQEYRDIGLDQDTLLKLIFILKDNHAKEVTNIEAEDASFAIENSVRISKSLLALKKFLISSKLYNYYKEKNQSFIPLYFITYHIFHKNIPTERIEHMFDNYDIDNHDFKNMYIWIYKSLLNSVFRSRGAGWIPYRTGIKKILEEMKKHKNAVFPAQQLFAVYRFHPLNFYEVFTPDILGALDRELVFYLLYAREESVRSHDIDHIHPKSLLAQHRYAQSDIHHIANYQLIDSSTNRHQKNAKPLWKWIETDVTNRELYLSRHFIPADPACWREENYPNFLEARKALIVAKINELLQI